MLDLYDLQVFLTAAETENFSEAGRLLQISQPAVSVHIQSLENHLSIQLFDRVGRNIRLNEVGEALIPIARNLLKEAQYIEQYIASHHGTVMGQLVIGCSTAAGKYILPGILARFVERHPDVQMVCHVGKRGQALQRLYSGECDLAISSLRVPRAEIEYRHFSDDRVILIAPPDHPWAAQGTIGLEELTRCSIIMRESGSGTTITLNRALAQLDMSVEMLRCNLVLENTESIVHAVCAGINPAFVSQVSAAEALARGDVVEVTVENLELIQHLYMARHTGFRASEAQKAFWDFTFAPENRDLLHFVL